MKRPLLLTAFLLCATFTAFSQDVKDTTETRTGYRFGIEVGLLANQSLQRIQRDLAAANLSADNIGQHIATFSIAWVQDTRHTTSEFRILLMTAPGDEINATTSVRRAVMGGAGIGGMNTAKIINKRRFILGAGLGYDFMLYRLTLQPANTNNVPLGQIAANVPAFTTLEFRRSMLLINPTVSADIRLNTAPGRTEFRLGGRVGYQFGLFNNRPWSVADGTVADLAPFRPGNLYYQFGLTILPPNRKK